MAAIYDFTTRKPIRTDLAELEIVGSDNPLIAGTLHTAERVLIDGLVPLALALELEALCGSYNERAAL